MTSRYSNFRFYMGTFFREAAKGLEEIGCTLQGKHLFKEQLNRTNRLMPIRQVQPRFKDMSSVFVAPNSQLIGKVDVGQNVSIFYGTVVRGDTDDVLIGDNTNIQDRCVISAAAILEHEQNPVIIGKNVTIESGSVLKSCRVEDGAYIGLGSTIGHGAIVGKNSVIAPGSYVQRNESIGEGEYWVGNPAQFERNLTKEEIESLQKSAKYQKEIADKHLEETSKSFEEVYRDQERYVQRGERFGNVFTTPPINRE